MQIEKMETGKQYRVKYMGDWLNATLREDESVKQKFFETEAGETILYDEVDAIKGQTQLYQLQMALNQETKYGLTFGQILSLIAVVGSIFMVWLSLNIRVAQAEVRIEELEKGRIENARNIQQLYQDNREDHKEMINKLDRLIENVQMKDLDK